MGRGHGQRTGGTGCRAPCCGPSGPWLSPPGHSLQERLREDTPPRRMGAAHLKARTGLKRVPSPQTEDRWRAPEVSGEKSRPDTRSRHNPSNTEHEAESQSFPA